jgi:hypothetical protein
MSKQYDQNVVSLLLILKKMVYVITTLFKGLNILINSG